tara:strand:- start:13257 stop:14012 length:756 start_codon:yes stop_codon:yes gene_type:complete
MDNNNIDLNVLPLITNEEGTNLKIPIHPNLPNLKKGFVIALIGNRNCGKTTLYTNLLLNPNMLNRENYDNAFIISPTIYNDRSAKHLRDAFKGSLYDKYNDGIVGDIVEYQQAFSDEDKPRSILIIDDSVGFKTNKLNYLATRSRHNNLNLIFSVQQTKAIKKVVRNNLTDVFIFKTKNKKELQDIYEEWGAMYGSYDEFLKMYKYATKEPYNFLYLKLESNPQKAFKNFSEDITQKNYDDLNPFNNLNPE